MHRILILDVAGSGHHPSYLRRILQSGILRVAHVIIAGPSSLIEHAELDDFRTQCDFYPLAILPHEQHRLRDFSAKGLVLREFTLRAIYGRTWRTLSRNGAFQLVLLPMLDGCVNAIALRGSPFGTTPWISITMRMQFHLRNMGVLAPSPSARLLRQALFHHLLQQPTLQSLLTIDPTLAEYAAQSGRTECGKVRYLPDTCNDYVLMDKAAAREQLHIPADATLILAYGALNERKGIFALLQAMAQPACSKAVHLLLAGSQDDGVKTILAGHLAAHLLAEGRLHLLPGYVPEEDVPALLSASDALWIGYVDFYTMSNILVLAAHHNLPPIVSEQGIIGWLARKHDFGLIVDPHSQGSILSALRIVADDPASLTDATRRAYTAFEAHNSASFQRTILDAVAFALPASSEQA